MIENSPPESDNDIENIAEIPNINQGNSDPDPLETNSISQKKSAIKTIPTSSFYKFRYRTRKIIKSLKTE